MCEQCILVEVLNGATRARRRRILLDVIACSYHVCVSALTPYSLLYSCNLYTAVVVYSLWTHQ